MTHRATERKIVEELTRHDRSAADQAPPAGLADAIKREVPAALHLHPDVAAGRAGSPADERPAFRSRHLLAAASVVALIGAGVVAFQVLETTPDPTAAPRETAPVQKESAAAAPAPRPPSEVEPANVATAPEATGREESAATPAPAAALAAPEARQHAAAGERSNDLEGRATPPPARKVPIPDPTPDEVDAAVDIASLITVTSESPLLEDEESSFPVAGVIVTDAGGSSPSYYDFDQFTEMPMTAESRRLEEELRRIDAEPAPVPVMPPSTGGTAEPNDQPYGDVFFRAYDTNPFVDTEDDPLSTFALDVDTGSYNVARRYLTDGHLPPPGAVRIEEMVNAFDYGDRPPPRGRRGADFALYAEGARTPFAPTASASYRVVRFAVAARALGAEERKPAVLTFVVDVSGSMAAENRLGLVKQSLRLLLEHLRSDDRVGLVVYGSHGHVLLEPTADHAAIGRAIGRLVSEGSTNAEEGLTLAYDLARRHYREGAINRIVLCSDGVANVGATGPESILQRIGREARGGIELTTVGFGMGNYNDVLMEQLADRGDGAYAYVDTLDEARRIFVENLTGTLQTVARDAKVQVEFDPEVVARWRLVGYENRDVPDEKFRDDTVDAGEVGAGHTVTAVYAIKLAEEAAPGRHAAVLRLRYRSADSGEVREVALPLTVRDLDRSWEEAPRSLQLAAIVAELGEVLKGTFWGRDTDLDALLRRAQAVSARYPGDARVAELAALVGRTAQLKRASE